MINQLKAQIQVGKTLGNSHISSPSMTDLSSETLETKSQQHPVRVGRSTEQHHQTQLPSKDVNASLASLSTLKKGIPKLTTEKAKAFEIFKNGYPSGPWIDGQKQLLKTKYTEAKALGENAQRIRNEISKSL